MLATFSDGIKTILAETYAVLCDGAERILLVMAGDPLKIDYAVAAERVPLPYALAMVLGKGNAYRLILEPAGRPSESTKLYWGVLDWIRFMLSGGLKQFRNYTDKIWYWQETA